MRSGLIFSVVITLVLGLVIGLAIGPQVFPKVITTTKVMTTTEVMIMSTTKTVTETVTTTETATKKILTENEYRTWAIKIALDAKELSEASVTTTTAASKLKISFSDAAEIFDALSALTMRMFEESKSIIPPKEYEEAHNHLVKALEYYHQAYFYMSKAFKEMNLELLKKATNLMNLANDELELARKALPTTG